MGRLSGETHNAFGIQASAGIITFSSGEHLRCVNLAEEIKLLTKPVFATGAKKEIDEVSAVFRLIDSQNVTLFKPDANGFHGSKTLWESVQGYEAFGELLTLFLSKI